MVWYFRLDADVNNTINNFTTITQFSSNVLGTEFSKPAIGTLNRSIGTFTPTGVTTGTLGLTVNMLAGAIDITFSLGGAQFEAGAFVTSYIPSTSAAVPRSGDAVKMTGVNFSSWYNQLAGTIAASRIDRETTQNAAVAAVNDDTTANRLMTYRSNLKSVSGLVAVASTAYNVPATTAPSGNVNLTAMTFTAGRAALCQNGGTVTSSTPPTMPVVTQLEIGSSTSFAYLNGTLAFLRYWNVAKTDAELQEITNPAKY